MAYIPYTISREHKERKMDKFTVEFYEKENGDIPAEEFLDGFNKGSNDYEDICLY